jgi:hypothetical protein
LSGLGEKLFRLERGPPKFEEWDFGLGKPFLKSWNWFSEGRKPFPEFGECNFGLRNLSPGLWNAGAKCETIPQK